MILRIVTFVMTALLILFAAVQYNDPDGWVWMLLYSYAASIGVGILIHRPIKWPAIAGAIGFSILALFLIPAELKHWLDIEEAREGFGATICAAWCILALVFTKHQSRKVDTHVD